MASPLHSLPLLLLQEEHLTRWPLREVISLLNGSYLADASCSASFTMTKKFHNIAVLYFGGARGDLRIAAFCWLPL